MPASGSFFKRPPLRSSPFLSSSFAPRLWQLHPLSSSPSGPSITSIEPSFTPSEPNLRCHSPFPPHPIPLLSPLQNPTTVIVVLSAVYFNLVNASLIAYSLFNTPPAPLPRLFLGAVVMTIGWGTPPSSFDDTAAINYNADAILRSLRTPSDSSYKIPRGGAFEFVSAANYFGETVEWGGFALAAASTPAWVFFLWTVANLAPRARSTHVWYRKTFKNYPPNRRAFIPFLW
jgi:3-oxo-5-alpha-steroid 4-dehydrogenase 1